MNPQEVDDKTFRRMNWLRRYYEATVKMFMKTVKRTDYKSIEKKTYFKACTQKNIAVVADKLVNVANTINFRSYC